MLGVTCLRPSHAGSASWAAMGTVVRSPAGALLATVVGSLGTACSDVVVDSIVVERSRNAPQVRPDRSTDGGSWLCSAALASLGIAGFYPSDQETWTPSLDCVVIIVMVIRTKSTAITYLLNHQELMRAMRFSEDAPVRAQGWSCHCAAALQACLPCAEHRGLLAVAVLGVGGAGWGSERILFGVSNRDMGFKGGLPADGGVPSRGLSGGCPHQRAAGQQEPDQAQV